MEAVAQVGVCPWFMCYIPLGMGRRRYFIKVLPLYGLEQMSPHLPLEVRKIPPSELQSPLFAYTWQNNTQFILAMQLCGQYAQCYTSYHIHCHKTWCGIHVAAFKPPKNNVLIYRLQWHKQAGTS